MRVAIHQPNLLPYLGFFAKWNAADALILLDNVQFTFGSKDQYLNRCRLGDGEWYTIPIRRHHKQMIHDVQPVNDWHPSMLKHRIYNDYRCLPFLKTFGLILDDAFERWNSPTIWELNLELILIGCEFGITVPIYIQSILGVDSKDADDRLIALVKAIGGDVYLSGSKGPEYMNKEKWLDSGLKVEVCHYTPIKYSRGERPWIPYLSVADAFCYHGKDTGNFLDVEITSW